MESRQPSSRSTSTSTTQSRTPSRSPSDRSIAGCVLSVAAGRSLPRLVADVASSRAPNSRWTPVSESPVLATSQDDTYNCESCREELELPRDWGTFVRIVRRDGRECRISVRFDHAFCEPCSEGLDELISSWSPSAISTGRPQSLSEQLQGSADEESVCAFCEDPVNDNPRLIQVSRIRPVDSSTAFYETDESCGEIFDEFLRLAGGDE